MAALRAALLFVLVAACANETMHSSRLDSSGLTVSTLSAAITLARPVRTLAAGARDYAYIGPVEINSMGHRDYYLWVGLASTVDREFVGFVPDSAVALLFVVDKEPMILPLRQWDRQLDESPYHGTAPVYETLAAPTTLDQIHRIATATSVELHVVADSQTAARYRHWDGHWDAWADFPTTN